VIAERVRWLQRWIASTALAVLMVIAAPMQAQAQGTDDLAALREQVRQLHTQSKYVEALPSVTFRWPASAMVKSTMSLPPPLAGWASSTTAWVAMPRPSHF
jgi:hypothetical protein